ncbi:MAG: hypothetical protein CMJ49_01535 [Planctomycetaceae bacterium]|nr:hypothetical protein [Planctomycetaceae bacterium]
MSSIPNPIAGSLTQTAVQQSQVARERDSARNRTERNAGRMKELIEQKLNTIEDSDLTTDDRMVIHEDESNAQYPGGQSEESEEQDDAAQPDARADGLDESGHLDVSA